MQDPNDKDTTVTEKGLTPEKLTGIEIKKPAVTSAGVKAVISSFRHLSKYVKPKNVVKLSLNLNQRKGFDCPGCAWPDPDDDRSTIAEYCENGIKAVSEEAQKNTIDREFFAKNSVSSLLKLSDYEIGKSGRLAEPMIIREGEDHYQPISWDELFTLLGEKLKSLNTPDEAIFYTSGRTSNEAAFMYQLFVRSYGTNNLPDCSNMCHESSGVALSKTVGIGKGSVTLEDFYKADLVIVMGQNPGTNHPRMLSALEKCKQNGGKIMSVNPIEEAGLMQFVNPQNPIKMITGGTKLTDLYVPLPINRDLPFIKALLKALYEKEKQHPGTVFDLPFIEQHTVHYEALAAHLEQENLDTLLQQTGIEKTVFEDAVNMLMASKNIIICWAMGLTQHRNSVDTIQEVVNLLLLKGSIGRPGAGTCPVRGHSNVQGDRTMGIWEKPKEAFLKKLDEVFTIHTPRKEGYDTVEAIRAMKDKKASVFFAMGGNFLSATPDTVLTAEALRNCDITAQVSTKLNRSHLVHGKIGLILPCKGRTDIDHQNGKEQFVTVENSTGYVSASRGVLSPSSDLLKSEPEIVAHLAEAALGQEVRIDWKAMTNDYGVVRNYIGKVIPGFENFNEKISLEKGFYIPNGARERTFNTPEKKAVFTVNMVEENPLADDELMMTTIRSHDQFNTTIYGLDDRYRGVYNERRIIFINPQDADRLGLAEKDKVNITSEYDGVKRQVNNFQLVYYKIARHCVATYFPEANALVSIADTARESNTPVYKSVKVRLKKV